MVAAGPPLLKGINHLSCFWWATIQPLGMKELRAGLLIGWARCDELRDELVLVRSIARDWCYVDQCFGCISVVAISRSYFAKVDYLGNRYRRWHTICQIPLALREAAVVRTFDRGTIEAVRRSWRGGRPGCEGRYRGWGHWNRCGRWLGSVGRCRSHGRRRAFVIAT